jgi:S1-C subfamily serine protease
MLLKPSRAALAVVLALVSAPLVARPAPRDDQPPGQMDMQPYVRLAVTGLIEEYKNAVIKNGEVTDRGTLVDSWRGEWSVGSGTIVTPDGLIVTNYHVLEDMLDPVFEYDETDKILTRFAPSKMLVGMVDARNPLAPVVDKYVAEDVAWLESRDIALVRIATDAKTGDAIKRKDFPYTQVGNPYAIPVLAPLTVFGYPGKGGRSINPSSGPFQGFTFDVSAAMDGSIKTSAQISGGNSGGAALYEGKLVAIPTRVSAKSEKGSDFGYLHPITWAAQVFSYATLRYGMTVPKLQIAWVESSYNTDYARTDSYVGGRIVSGQSKMAVGGATMILFRTDRTLEQIQELRMALSEIRTVKKVQKYLKDGMPEEKVAETMELKVQEVRAYRDMKVDISAMSPDVQAYYDDEFFYDIDDSTKDGFVFLSIPRGKDMKVAILKDGFRDWVGTLKAVTTLEADIGKIQITMR